MARIKRYPVVPERGRFEQGRAAHAVESRREFGIDYQRVKNDHQGLARGALWVDERVVPAYPSIGRIHALADGIRAAFRDTFVAEEKMDGYNVRLFSVGGRPTPVTRSGMICPFTLDRLPDLVDLAAVRRLFDDHPELVICAEVAGRGNPYMPTYDSRVSDDVALYAFDVVCTDSGRFLLWEDRNRLLTRYGIPQVPLVGKFHPQRPAPLLDALRRLDEDGGEGVVLKSMDESMRVKYATPSINLTDIATDAALEMELPGEFFTHRVVRMVVALRELYPDRPRDAEADALGRLLVEGFDRALDEMADNGRLSRRFTVRLRTEAACDALLEHLSTGSRSVRVEEVARRAAGDHIELQLLKVYRKSTDRLRHVLSGGPVFD